ncbi:Transmembrane protein [Hirschfeldia incana]|nr:Transmembrane protein [Hirschfeldia incana]KAJ0258190.1 Transmembrane protein [Hirschfeldia incana]
MMAAGEARAVWQRTVNRYFVQEDAKRAPKLTSSCQSSSSSSSTAVPSNKQVEDSRPSVDPQNQSPSCPGFMPRHPNPNFPHLLPPHNNTNLWAHHHHHIQQDHKEQVKTSLEAEAEGAKSERFQEFVELMETRERYGSVGNDESSEKKLTNELAFDPTSPWNPLSSEKAAPWWRTTDKDELASLVAQRSLDFVENCDLPTPQKMNRSYYGSPRSFDSDAFRDQSFSNQTTHLPMRGNSFKNRTEEASSESDLSKSELLEALRRSQTRAREAENMAKEACAEKEHLVKLLLKQASELFGYKQLLQLLQLESLYLQIKSKKIEDSKETPPPWSSTKGRKGGRKRRSKRSKPNGFVGLALGMSLVGAGLLLGWTVGWMQMLSF